MKKKCKEEDTTKTKLKRRTIEQLIVANLLNAAFYMFYLLSTTTIPRKMYNI